MRTLFTIAVSVLFAAGISYWVTYNTAQQSLGATVLTTNLSDTVNTFRTNVNTSLSNLNSSIVSTTSAIAAQQVLYATGVNTMASVATSSLTAGSGLTLSSGTFGYQIGGTNATLAISAPVSIANGGTASTTGGYTSGVTYYDGTRLTNTSLFRFTGTNLGVGTTSPGTLLSIGNTAGWNFREGTATTTSYAYGIDLKGGGCFAVNGTCLTSSSQWTTSGSDVYYGTGSGKVGVATSTPFALLSVANTVTTSALTPLFAVASTTSGTATTTVFRIDHKGHIIVGGGTPTLSSCGTSPVINGNDVVGFVKIGGGASACTLTFAATYGTAPSCSVGYMSGTAFTVTPSTTPTTLVITSSGGIGGDWVSYMCLGF